MRDFTESFDDGDDNAELADGDLDLTWSHIEGTHAWRTINQMASPRGDIRGLVEYDRAEHDTDTDDQYVEFVVHALSGASSAGGPCARMAANGDSYMAMAEPGNLEIRKTISGSRITIGSPVSIDTSNLPKVLRTEVEGSEIRAYWDGVLEITETDTDIPTGTRAGLFGFEDDGEDLGLLVDDVAFGDIGGGTPATVSAVTATATATAHPPTVTASGSATVAATTATATATAHAPDVLAGVSLAGGPATATATAHAPTVHAGATVSAVTAMATGAAHAPAVTAATGEALVNLTLTALAPVLAHGPALSPQLLERTATTPALAAHTALTPETADRAPGEPELGHGDPDDPAVAHGDVDHTLGRGQPGTPTT